MEPEEEWQSALKRRISELNERFLATAIGGEFRIVEYRKATTPGQSNYVFHSHTALVHLFDNEQIKTGEKPVGRNLVDVFDNPIKAWMKHPDRRTYRGGMTFDPSGNVDSDVFNTWTGLTVEPVRNDKLIQPIIDHIREVICDGKEELFSYLVCWLAAMIQHPEKPARSAIVLRGPKGAGKGLLGHFIGSLFGPHSLHISNAKHFVGNFNSMLADRVFLFCDEAFYSGDKAHESILKALITENVMVIERKGIDAVQYANCLHVLMCTNLEFAVPASADERRYCVIDVSPKRIGDFRYFDHLAEITQDDKVKAAFLAFLMDHDVEKWRPSHIPESIGLKDQRLHSLDSDAKWLIDGLVNEAFFGAKGWENSITSEAAFSSYCQWCDANKISEFRRKTQIQLVRYLGTIFARTKVPTTDGYYKRGVLIGGHATALEEACNHHKLDMNELIKD